MFGTRAEATANLTTATLGGVVVYTDAAHTPVNHATVHVATTDRNYDTYTNTSGSYSQVISADGSANNGLGTRVDLTVICPNHFPSSTSRFYVRPGDMPALNGSCGPISGTGASGNTGTATLSGTLTYTNPDGSRTPVAGRNVTTTVSFPWPSTTVNTLPTLTTDSNGNYSKSGIAVSTTGTATASVKFSCPATSTSSAFTTPTYSTTLLSGQTSIIDGSCGTNPNPVTGGGGGGGATTPAPTPDRGYIEGYVYQQVGTGKTVIPNIDVNTGGWHTTTNSQGYYKSVLFNIGASISVRFNKDNATHTYVKITKAANTQDYTFPDNSIWLEGIVKVDGLPPYFAKGAEVKLTQGTINHYATVDAAGNYKIIGNVTTGSYALTATLANTDGLTNSPGTLTLIGSNKRDIILKPGPTSLTGHVFYQGTSIPVSDVLLSVFQPNNTTYNHGQYPKTGSSDKDGLYTVPQLMPGTAKIAISGKNITAKTVSPPNLVAGQNTYNLSVARCAPNYVKGTISSSDGKALPSKIVLEIYDQYGSKVYQTIYPVKTATTVFYSSKGRDNHGYLNGAYKVRVQLEKNAFSDTLLAPEKTITFTSDCGGVATADFSLIYTATEALQPTYKFVVQQSYDGTGWTGEPISNVRLSIYEDYNSGNFNVNTDAEGIAILKDVTGNISKSTMVTLSVFGADGKRLEATPGIFPPNPSTTVNTILVTVLNHKANVCVRHSTAHIKDFWICLPPSEVDNFIRNYSSVFDAIDTQVNYLRGLYPIASDDPPELDIVSAGNATLLYAGLAVPKPPACLNPDHPDTYFDDNRIYLNADLFRGSLDKIKFLMKGTVTHEFGHLFDWKKGGCVNFSSDKTLKDLDGQINTKNDQNDQIITNPLFADFYSTIDKVENGQGHAWENLTEFYATGFDIFHNYRPAMDAVIAALEITNPKKAAAWRGAMKTLYDTVTSQALSM